MSRLVLQNVRKTFKHAIIVERLNLRVEDREFLVILGPSGCGKSTTLNMIAGLEDVTEGDIFIRGRNVTRLPPKDRRIAMVFQNYALYPHKTVAGNIGFGLKMARTRPDEVARQVSSVAQVLGIEELLQRKPRQLSGGQRQRVAVGRAIVRNPDLFLFDEPLSNLDAKLRGAMRVELKQLHERLNATTVYVTHDQTEAMTMATRVVVMRAGVIQQIGFPLEVYNHPCNRFVGEFIGSPTMNFLRCRLAREGERVYGVNEALRLLLPAERLPALERAATPDVVLGVRPENVVVHVQEPDSATGGDAGAEVTAVEPLGNETYLSLRMGAIRLTAVVPPDRSFRTHQMVRVAIDPGKVHVFRADAGGEAIG